LKTEDMERKGRCVNIKVFINTLSISKYLFNFTQKYKKSSKVFESTNNNDIYFERSLYTKNVRV
jgi:hypothetical protein